MSHEVNLPEIVAEVRQSFERYNVAIESGDTDALNGFFWNSPNTVRFGNGEHLFGHAEIASFRSGVWKPGGARKLERLAITTLGRDFGTTWALFRRGDGTGPISRQSQTWARFPEGWRIIAAHVSALPG
jgi:hypothetical protein